MKPAASPSNVSVIIPAFNRAKTVGRAVSSILTQSVLPREIIVVDDGSSDDLEASLTLFADRVRVIRHTTNKGASAARNTGIRAATGELIAFLDSDDVWTPHKLETQLAFMNTHAPNASCTGFDTVSQESGQTCTAFRPYPELLSIEHFVWGCYTSPGSTLIATRNILLEIGGYDVQFARYEDWDLLLRLAGASPEGIGFIDDALATIHVERKISSDAWLSALDMLLEKHGESIKNQHKALLRKFRSGIHFNRASAFASRRAWRAMFTELAKSMTIVPIGNWPVRVILAERLRTTS